MSFPEGLLNTDETVKEMAMRLKESIDKMVVESAMNITGHPWMIVSMADGKYSIGDVALPDDLAQWGVAIVAAMAEKELTTERITVSGTLNPTLWGVLAPAVKP